MRRAFTLVECLVVIGLIATLAAMLLPVVAEARRPAKAVPCASNLRQIGFALALYGEDFDDRYPRATDPVKAETRCGSKKRLVLPLLHGVLRPYVKSNEIWRCPLDAGVPDVHGEFVEPVECDLPGVGSLYGEYGSSYVYRADLGLASVSQAVTLADPYHGLAEHGPSEVPVVYDAYGLWHGGADEGQRRVEALMADGHVAPRSQTQIATAEYWIVP